MLLVAALLAACGRPGTAGSPSPRPTASAPATTQPLFSDDFRGGQLDRSKWSTCYPWAQSGGCTNSGNNELEWYLPQQVSVQNDMLRLQATKESTPGQDAQGQPK